MQRLIRSIVIFKHQQNPGKLPGTKENLLNRDFNASNIFQKLVTDIVYSRETRWLDLSCVCHGPLEPV